MKRYSGALKKAASQMWGFQNWHKQHQASASILLQWFFNRPLTLKIPNETIKFPLPNTWCDTDELQFSKQHSFMIVKQVFLSIKNADHKKEKEILEDKDIARGTIRAMNFLGTLHDCDISNVKKAIEKFGLLNPA